MNYMLVAHMIQSMYSVGLIWFFSIISINLNCRNCNSNNNKHINQNWEGFVSHQEKLSCRTSKVESNKSAIKIIVLLHGLDRLSYDFKEMEAVLQRKFPDVLLLALKSVNKDSTKKYSPTSSLSIERQAELAYEELKNEVKNLPPITKQLVLVGHSQGGLRAFTLIRKFGEKLRKETGITIGRLITIGTPWQGAPIAEHLKDQNKVKTQLRKLRATLNAIQVDYEKKLIRHVLKTEIHWPITYFYRKYGNREQLGQLLRKEGIGAIRPDSNFICSYVASELQYIAVPITAIAGVSGGFEEIFSLFRTVTSEALHRLNCIYAEIIGGDPHCEHDMLLPVSTQHAEGLAKKDFECVKIYGTCHGNKVGIPVKNGIPELKNDKVIQAVVAAIAKTFSKTDTIAISK